MDFTSGLGGFMLGTVLENNDKQKKGMLKIRLAGQGEECNILENVKQLSCLAGENYGAYILPEVGDQVIVGFLDGCFDRPFVLGSLYTISDSMLTDSFHDKNAVKRLRTKGGTVVALSDDKDADTVKIHTPEHLSIVLCEKKQTIELKAEDTKITLDGKGGIVSIEAKKKLQLKVGSADITMQSDGSISVSGNDVKLDGKSVTVKSVGAMTVKGQKTELSGAVTEVKASGILTVSGQMTKIN